MKNPFKVLDPRDYIENLEQLSPPRKPKRRKRRESVRVDKAFSDREFLEEMQDQNDGDFD